MPQKCPSNYVIRFLFQAPPSNIVLLFPPCLPNNAPPNSLKDPNLNPRMKQHKKKIIGAHSLICNILKVGRHVGASVMHSQAPQ
jgi:hypothetical protein